MVKDGDNCSCPVGFTPEGAAGCKAAPLTTTVSPSTSVPPQCPGNQVKLENGCSCPSGMVKDGDNCSCPVGFTPDGAAGCKAAPLTTTVSPSTSVPPQCPGNQVKLENACNCPSGMVKDGDNCSCPVGFTPEGAAGCKAAPLTTTVSPSTSVPPQCPGNQVKLENACNCPSGMVKDGDNCSCPVGFTPEGMAGCKGEERQNER
ncbi:balbiani ring protein 3-like [Eleginops maclovinus]|uniref:balbiani ring protein 3-like n=1 Tax=Eleginops maclovinus TaxID=56733 RepID=UPI00307FE55E